MASYSSRLNDHLARYRVDALGISEDGVWRGRRYSHILPIEYPQLNLLETVRQDCWRHVDANAIQLHQYFHHLNSSQAFAFNLLLPFAGPQGSACGVLLDALGLTREPIETCQFEVILDESEGTNFDCCLTGCDGRRIGVEVKLSEQSFGPARNDERHRQKRGAIYASRLHAKVHPDALTDQVFFPNYQILRNACYADPTRGHQTVFLLPWENKRLRRRLTAFLDRFLLPPIQPFVRVAYAEDVVDSLRLACELPIAIRSHYNAVAKKYALVSRIVAGVADRADVATLVAGDR
jgi:hypothetical protein